MNDIIKIEVQYFNGCPNSPEMIRRIKEAIKGKEEIIEYNEVLVESNELAEKLKFRGSPTVLINGEDIEGRGKPDLHHLTAAFMKMVCLMWKKSRNEFSIDK